MYFLTINIIQSVFFVLFLIFSILLACRTVLLIFFPVENMIYILNKIKETAQKHEELDFLNSKKMQFAN